MTAFALPYLLGSFINILHAGETLILIPYIVAKYLIISLDSGKISVFCLAITKAPYLHCKGILSELGCYFTDKRDTQYAL